MRVVQQVIAAFVLSSIYTYANPLGIQAAGPVPRSEAASGDFGPRKLCAGYTEEGCAGYCQSQGYSTGTCEGLYVNFSTFVTDSD